MKGKPVLSYLTGSASCSSGLSLGMAKGKQAGAAPDTLSSQLGKGQRAAGYAGRLDLGKGGKAMVNYYDPEQERLKDVEDDLPPGLTGDDGPEPFDSCSHRGKMSTTADEKTGERFEELRKRMQAKASTRKDAPPIYSAVRGDKRKALAVAADDDLMVESVTT